MHTSASLRLLIPRKLDRHLHLRIFHFTSWNESKLNDFLKKKTKISQFHIHGFDSCLFINAGGQLRAGRPGFKYDPLRVTDARSTRPRCSQVLQGPV